MNNRTLTEIWIYPIKSLPGISLQKWEVKYKGLLYDRRWMLIDEHGKFISQRTASKMVLFKLQLEGNVLTISNSNDQISLVLDQQPTGESFQAQIWNDSVTVTEVDKKYSDWFSAALDIHCRLVFFPEENVRPVDPEYVDGHLVSLADGYPFLIIGEASLSDLNNRLMTNIAMKRFRPNFVFQGGLPFEEDTWKKFTIGNIEFAGVKPCARCAIPTINPDTGEKGIEPTKTLATYRAMNNKIYFGENLITLSEGPIHVGDQISINTTI